MSLPVYMRFLNGASIIITLAGLILFSFMAIYVVTGLPGPANQTGLSHYFLGFTGTSLMGWGLCLRAGLSEQSAPALGVATAIVLMFMSAMRVMLLSTDDVVRTIAGPLPAVEVVLFGVLAVILFVGRPKKDKDKTDAQ